MVSHSQRESTASTSVDSAEASVLSNTAAGSHNSGMKQNHPGQSGVIPARNTDSVDVSVNQGRMISKREKQLTTMTVVMTTAFFLCIMPLYVHITVFYFVDWRCDARLTAILWWGSAIAHCLNVLNSAINFFIYVMTGSKFRADLMTLLHLK